MLSGGPGRMAWCISLARRGLREVVRRHENALEFFGSEKLVLFRALLGSLQVERLEVPQDLHIVKTHAWVAQHILGLGAGHEGERFVGRGSCGFLPDGMPGREGLERRVQEITDHASDNGEQSKPQYMAVFHNWSVTLFHG